MSTFGQRLKNTWNAFLGRDPTPIHEYRYGSSHRPDRVRLSRSNVRSIVSSIYNQIAVDCSSININHVRLDEENKFETIINDALNDCLNRSANIDQTGRALIRDAVMSMLDEGVVAIVPVETDVDPYATESYKILELRTAKIMEWFPYSVRLELYDSRDGQIKNIILDKRLVAIIENPFYSIMNEPNSTLQRLIRILNQLDRTNEENSAGKLDLIIQLPYIIKSEQRREQAEKRRKEIVAQLTGSEYGIAYTDGTERVIQLNRGVENNLWAQAKDLLEELYNQLGLSRTIFDGTADEKTLLNYNNRTIEPILSAIVEEMERKWLSKTAKTQRQGIRYFKAPFKLVPVAQLAEIADKFTRNEIMTSNEFRSIIGLKPSKDPKADRLINSNLNHPDEENDTTIEIQNEEKEENVNEI